MSWITKQRALRAAHAVALEEARLVYERCGDETTVISRGQGPGYSFVSASSPERVAWDVYFESMVDQGQDGWKTKRRFDRELKRWKAER